MDRISGQFRYVVRRQHPPGPPLPQHLTREGDPDRYQHETPARVPAGSILLYSMRTYHRGSAMRAMTGAGCTHDMGLRVGTYRWLGQSAFHNRAAARR